MTVQLRPDEPFVGAEASDDRSAITWLLQLIFKSSDQRGQNILQPCRDEGGRNDNLVVYLPVMPRQKELADRTKDIEKICQPAQISSIDMPLKARTDMSLDELPDSFAQFADRRAA